jgi:hypothetical protein
MLYQALTKVEPPAGKVLVKAKVMQAYLFAGRRIRRSPGFGRAGW